MAGDSCCYDTCRGSYLAPCVASSTVVCLRQADDYTASRRSGSFSLASAPAATPTRLITHNSLPLGGATFTPRHEMVQRFSLLNWTLFWGTLQH